MAKEQKSKAGWLERRREQKREKSFELATRRRRSRNGATAAIRHRAKLPTAPVGPVS
jgi:hypothetical protein